MLYIQILCTYYVYKYIYTYICDICNIYNIYNVYNNIIIYNIII